MNSAIAATEPTATAWRTVLLADVCQFKPPKRIPRQTLEDDSQVSFVPMGDLGELRKHFEAKSTRKFGDVVKGYTYFADNDVLCAKITPCFENGKLGIAQNLENGVGFGSSEFVVMRPKGEILPEYLYYYLSRDIFREAGKAVMSGAVGHKRVPKEYFENLEIPLPPIDEQKRIVAVLDQAFAALNRAHLNTARNLTDADAIIGFIATGLLDQASTNNGTATTLGELCTIARGGSPRPIQRYLTDSADGVNWIKISDASASGQYIYETKQRIRPDGISKSRFVRSGAFLLTNSMSFGRPYILKTDGCIHDGWLVLEPDYSLVDQSYLYHLLGSGQIYREFDRLAAGSTVRNLNINLVSNVRVTLPSLQVQQELVRKIAAQQERYDKLLQGYQSQVEQLSELRQSLLHSAFVGNLV